MKIKLTPLVQIGIVTLLLVMLWTSRTDTRPPDRYDWGTAGDFSELYETARSGRKPLLIYFNTDWCSFCEKFNEQFLDDDEVYAYLSNFRMVQVNPERGSREDAIAEQYNVKGFPSFLVTHPHMRKTKRIHPFKKGGVVWTTAKFIDETRLAIASTARQKRGQIYFQ